MTARVPLRLQIQAVEIVIGIAVGTRSKPRAAELERLLEQANAAVRTLVWAERNVDKLNRAFGNVEGERL